MTSLIGIELLKVRTQRAMMILLLGALGMTLLSLASLIFASQIDPAQQTQQFPLESEFVQRRLLSAGGGMTLVTVFAVLGITSEYRHRTITSTFLGVPSRIRVLAAKLITYALLAVAYGIVLATLTTPIVVGFLSVEGVPLALDSSQIATDYLRDLAGLALSATFGFAIGALVANQIGSVVIVLVEPLASGILTGFLPEAGRFLPSPSLDAFLLERVGPDVGFGYEGLLSSRSGVLVFGAYIAALAVAGWFVTERRDIT